MSKGDNVKIWDFWLWEYQRRNLKYREDFDRFCRFREHHVEELTRDGKLSADFWNKHGLNVDALRLRVIKEEFIDNTIVDKEFRKKCIEAKRDIFLLLKIFVGSHGIMPKDYNDGPNSKDILEKAKANDIAFFANSEIVRYPKLSSKVLRSSGKKVIVELDLSQTIKVVLAEIEKIFFDEKTADKEDDLFGESKYVFDAWEKLRKIELKASFGNTKKKRRIRADILPRAFGLCLYDNVGKNKSKGVAEFAQNIVQNDTVLSMKKSKNDDSHLFKLMENARECVKKVQIIPLT